MNVCMENVVLNEISFLFEMVIKNYELNNKSEWQAKKVANVITKTDRAA